MLSMAVVSIDQIDLTVKIWWVLRIREVTFDFSWPFHSKNVRMVTYVHNNIPLAFLWKRLARLVTIVVDCVIGAS